MQATVPSNFQPSPQDRIAWVDYAKGICILLVVMFHTVNHYEASVGTQGWMRWIVDFSRPFRMPDFFMIAGLFLSRTINTDLTTFIDKKVVHFAYFYLLWLALTLLITDNDVLRADPVAFVTMYAWSIVQPTGVLWFVHMLAVFYVVTRLLRRVPKWGVLAVAAALQIAHQAQWIDTPSYAINRLMDYYVFFFLGYAVSNLIFDVADRVKVRPLMTATVLVGWSLCNGWLVHSGLHNMPVYGLLMGVAGGFAVVEAAALLSRFASMNFLRYCGQNSIVIYLTFFIPMTLLERALAENGWIPDVGWASFAILTLSVVLPLAFHAAIRKTPLIALYARPKMFRLGNKKLAMQAALA